jgi:hypothetical protein
MITPDQVTTNDVYIFNGGEVVMTGRVAARNTEEDDEDSSKSRRRRRGGGAPDMLVEITPADVETGSWKQWVRPSELYRIIE